MSTNAPLKKGTTVDVTPKDGWPYQEFQGTVNAYVEERDVYVVIDQDGDCWDVDGDQLEVIPPTKGKLLYLESPNDHDPMCRCPVCGYEGSLVSSFSLLAAGFNGIKKGDPDDIDAQECGACGAYLTWDHKEYIIEKKIKLTVTVDTDGNVTELDVIVDGKHARVPYAGNGEFYAEILKIYDGEERDGNETCMVGIEAINS